MTRYQWDFSVVFTRPELWLQGLGITFAYAIGTIILGMVVGVLCGILMLSNSRIIRATIDIYIQTFRCTPVLVQVIWFYYALPNLLNIQVPAWIAAGTGLSLYMGAFCAEIFRAGIISVGKGQWEAAKALGMTPNQLMRRIILPQAFKRMVPPIVSQSVLQFKNTSLLYIVSVPDLMYAATTIVSDSYRPLEVYTAVAGVYFVLLYPLQKLAKRLEARDDI
jgi:polar amino acid transport system permease protein